MKKLVFSTILVLQAILAFAQQPTGISGKVIDAKTNLPLQNVVTSIQNTNLTQLTDADGKFRIIGIGTGSQILKVKSDGYKEQLLQLEIIDNQVLGLGVVVMEENLLEIEQQTNLITISESDLGDDNSGSEGTSGLLQASRDAFQQAAAFNFGQARFSVRGIDNEYSNVLINGVLMNRISDGRPQYSNWGGLNDATRNQEFTDGSKPSDYVFGGIAGTQHIHTNASVFRPGTRISFLSTNTNYNYRIMGTHASGMDKDGWGFVISAGRRWAEEGFFEGTTYSANSFFASVEKRINDKHSLNFTSMYAQNRRGKNSPNTEEVNDLVGFKYNSYWGYQNGEIRNSRVKNVEEPIFILNHFWKINDKNKLTTSLGYQFGAIGNSRIDFTRADNPDPTYYRNLPSYHTTAFDGVTHTPDLVQSEEKKNNFLANRQIDWKDIYRINKENLAEGSRIVLYEDRTDDKTLTANSILASQLSENIFLNAGANYMKSKSSNFKNMLDLLGGNFFVDKNTFGSTNDQQQSDLNNLDRKVIKGDKYGYNYDVNATNIDAFTQFKFTYDKVDFYLSQSFAKNVYQREGLYKNGYYPNNSFGKSDKKEFENFGFKGGLTYKITGQHLLDFNAVYMSKAPNTKDVFPNARLNNTITDNISNESIRSIDASYVIRTPKFKARFTGYFNEIENSTDIAFYFADGLAEGSNFVSEVVTGINKKNRGGEIGLEYQITSTIKASAATAYGEYTFTNNPNLTISNDDNGTIIDYGKAKMTGYKVPGMPQQAYSFGLEYRDPKFWWIGANGNYISDNYVDVAPLLRTDNFRNSSDPAFGFNQTLADQYLRQEKFDPFYLVNLVGGKSWRVNKTTIGLFANINNLLDTKYRTGGFEQARNATYSELYKDHQGPTRSFGNKYFYGYGRTYMVNLYVNF